MGSHNSEIFHFDPIRTSGCPRDFGVQPIGISGLRGRLGSVAGTVASVLIKCGIRSKIYKAYMDPDYLR